MDGPGRASEFQGLENDGKDRQAVLRTSETANGRRYMAEQDGGGQDVEERSPAVPGYAQHNG
eukprot:13201049-Heterocapsa_arctica.AAC.1